jgi:ribonuclease E
MEERINIGNPRKPIMKLDGAKSVADDLRSRLDLFMPALAKSNQELKAEQNMEAEDCPDDGEHIALELACGVLEECPQPPNGSSSSNVTIPRPGLPHDNDELERTLALLMPQGLSTASSSASSDSTSSDEDDDDDDSEDDEDDSDDEEQHSTGSDSKS